MGAVYPGCLPDLLANKAVGKPSLAVILAGSPYICVIKSMANAAAVSVMPKGYHQGIASCTRDYPLLPFFASPIALSKEGSSLPKAESKSGTSALQTVTADITNTGKTAFGVPGPLGGAEQRRVGGGCRLALFEARRAEFSETPASPSSAGNPA